MLTLERLKELNIENERNDTLYIVEVLTYKPSKHCKGYLYREYGDWYYAGSNDLQEAIKEFKNCIHYTSMEYKYYKICISEAYGDGDVYYEPLKEYTCSTVTDSDDCDFDAMIKYED